MNNNFDHDKTENKGKLNNKSCFIVSETTENLWHMKMIIASHTCIGASEEQMEKAEAQKGTALVWKINKKIDSLPSLQSKH